MSTRMRVGVLAVAVAVLAAAALLYGLLSRGTSAAPARPDVPLSRGPVALAQDALYFRNAADGAVATVPAGTPAATRTAGDLRCERFYARAERAVCLRHASGPLPASEVLVLDRGLREQRTVQMPGIPSRAQLSDNGRMVSWTTFVTGDSYARGSFSTRTGILDTRTGQLLTNIEDIPLFLDGKRYHAIDVNYWGVTFAPDDDTFYATLSTAGQTYLVRGSVREWRAETVRRNVECPSMSPDGTRLAFKKRVRDGARPWQPYVLDLATMVERPVAETGNVDDQIAWLDERTLLYGKQNGDALDVWTVPADGSGRPELLVPAASSPSVAR